MKQLSTSARGRGHKILKFFAPILPSRCTRKLKEEEQALETIARIRLQDEPCPKHAYEPNFVGEIILGRYQLERLLARTDDFVIWLVSDLAEARIWSVKIYHVSTTHSGKQWTPGEKEIQERLYTTSVSPHLLASVKTFDLLEGKHLGFMMPLCGTLSLEEYRSRAPGCIVPVSPARQISGQVVRALEALHGNGIMHGRKSPVLPHWMTALLNIMQTWSLPMSCLASNICPATSEVSLTRPLLPCPSDIAKHRKSCHMSFDGMTSPTECSNTCASFRALVLVCMLQC